MARVPRPSIPKTTNQALERYTYQQAYKLRPDTPMPRSGGTKRGTTGGLGASKVKGMADDSFPIASTPYFQDVWDAMKGRE